MGFCFQSYLGDPSIDYSHQSKEYEEYFLASPCLLQCLLANNAGDKINIKRRREKSGGKNKGENTNINLKAMWPN